MAAPNIKKKGDTYYARFVMAGRELWFTTNQTSERQAARIAARYKSQFDKERTARSLTNSIILLAKQLATREITKAECRSILASHEQEILKESLEFIDSVFPSPPIYAADIWRKYLASSPDNKPSTLKDKEIRFNKFAAWAGDMDMGRLSFVDCKRFLKQLGVKNQTVNSYVAYFSSIWKKSPELPNPWTAELRLKATPEHKKPFTRDQVRLIVKYCSDHQLFFWEFATQLAYYTGLRLKDVIYFSRDKITADGFIDLIPEKTSARGKRIRIKIRPTLQKLIDALPRRGKYFFPEMVERYEKSRVNSSYDFQAILKALKLNGSGYGFHSLRHTFVTEAKNAGVNTRDIQAVVGHEAIEITEGVYYHGEQNADLSAYPEL